MKLFSESFLCATARAASVIFCRLPYRWNLAIGRTIGFFAYYVLPKKRKVVEANLRTAFSSTLSLREIRSLSKEDRKQIGEIISRTQETFGNPHRHAGLGLRDLGKDYYEVRWHLGLRLVFQRRSTSLYFRILGNHHEVKHFLKVTK